MVSLAQGNTLRKSVFCLGFSLKILFPYKFRLNSDDKKSTEHTEDTEKDSSWRLF